MMYEQFYGLTRTHFDLSPDPDMAFTIANPSPLQSMSEWTVSLHDKMASTGALLWEKYTRH